MSPTETIAATALSRFLTFDRTAWAHLRDSTPLTLSEADVTALFDGLDATHLVHSAAVIHPAKVEDFFTINADGTPSELGEFIETTVLADGTVPDADGVRATNLEPMCFSVVIITPPQQRVFQRYGKVSAPIGYRDRIGVGLQQPFSVPSIGHRHTQRID